MIQGVRPRHLFSQMLICMTSDRDDSSLIFFFLVLAAGVQTWRSLPPKAVGAAGGNSRQFNVMAALGMDDRSIASAGL